MKATGIVRRIDDLGRVVVPKEIRKTLRIREGDSLEIFTDGEGKIILKKYSPIGELSMLAKQYAETLAQVLDCLVGICDMEQVVAAGGPGKKEIQEKGITKELEKLLRERTQKEMKAGGKQYIDVIEDQENYEEEIITPIICQGDVIGGVILLSKHQTKRFAETDKKMAECIAGVIGRQMEQ